METSASRGGKLDNMKDHTTAKEVYFRKKITVKYYRIHKL